MRAVHQILELAIKLLDNDPFNRDYMCTHLNWMESHNVITELECADAQSVIMRSIRGHVTLAGYLRLNKIMPQNVAVRSPEYGPYQLAFYTELVAKLRAADPLFLIIEAAYHCGYSHKEIHAAVKDAGLPETSDETIANLLGEYADSIKE